MIAERDTFIVVVAHRLGSRLSNCEAEAPVLVADEGVIAVNQSATASLMRSINRAAILDLIRQHSPIARTVIAERLHMSLPTVMRIVDGLITEDLVCPCAETERTGGRQRPLLQFNGSSYAVVAVDLGGTKMFGAVADLAGNLEQEICIPSRTDNSDDSLERLCDVIDELLQTARSRGQRVRGIGVGAPGVTLSQEGIVTWAPSLGWRNLPLKQILSRRFDLPVFVENDVNLSALGELGFGAGIGTRNLVCIAVGTGIGAGIIVGGTIHRGYHEAAGEIGYMLPERSCLNQHYGQFGALETLASGIGIAERGRRLLSKLSTPGSVDGLTAEDVFAAARQGETWAQEVVDETADYLSLSISAIQCLLDPDVIILSGGVAASSDLLIEPILERLRGTVPVLPRIVASSLGYRATVMGAIMLVLKGTTEHFVVQRLP